MRVELKTAAGADAVTQAAIKQTGFINNTQDDDEITALIPVVTKAIENYTGRKMIDQDWYIYYDAVEFRNRMPLSTFNCSAINEVLTYDTDDSSTAITSTNYRLADDEIIFDDHYDPSVALRNFDAIRIDVTAGYGAASTNVPAALSEAMKKYAIHLLRRDEVEENSINNVPLMIRTLAGPYRHALLKNKILCR